MFDEDSWICHKGESEMLAIVDTALAALGDAPAIRQVGPVRRGDAIDRLVRLRNEIEPKSPEATKTKILREIEAYVRRYDMICDDLWDREEPIHQVYDWCVNVIGRPAATFSDICHHIQDALHELNLD